MLVILCSLSLSCGYTTGSSLSGNLRTVHVETFKNKIDYAAGSRRNIYLPLLEINLRNKIIERFQFDGNLTIQDADFADLLLKGELISYERGGLRFSRADDVEEYRVHVIVSMQLWDTKAHELMWEEPSFAGEATYFVSGVHAKSEEVAVEEAVEDLARRIVERTIENW